MAKQQSGGGYYFTPQSVTTQIDWSDVSKQVTDTLSEETKAREDRRQGIEDATRETINTLQESMQSQHGGTNEMAVDFSARMTDTLMMAKNQVLNGDMTQRNYNLIYNNALSGSKNMGTMVNSVNENYEEWQRRTDAGENIASIEEWLAEKYYGFAQFGNSDGSSKPYINPLTGAVTMGIQRLNKDGVLQMSKNQDDYATVLSLLGRTKARYKHYDPLTSAKNYVGTLGEQINVLSGGSVQVRNDLLQGVGLDDPKNIALKETLERLTKAERAYTPNFAAVLADNIITIPLNSSGRYDPVNGVEKEFKYTNDPDVAAESDHWILMTNDNYPVPMLDPEDQTDGTKAQLEMYKEFQIETMLSTVRKEEKPRPYQRPTPPNPKILEMQNEIRNASQAADFLETLYLGESDIDIRGAISGLSALSPDKEFSNGRRTSTGIQFEVTEMTIDPSTRLPVLGVPHTVTLPYSGLNKEGKKGNLSLQQFIKNSLPTFTDFPTRVDLSGYDATVGKGSKKATARTAASGIKAYNVTAWEDIAKKMGDYVFRNADEVFEAPLTTGVNATDDKTAKTLGDELTERMKNVIFTEKQIGPENYNSFEIRNTKTGRIIENFKMPGLEAEIQMPMVGNTAKDWKDLEDRGTFEEGNMTVLKSINQYLYSLMKTGLTPNQDYFKNQIKERGKGKASVKFAAPKK